ncbi:Cytochrome c [Flavobacterium resistens]|uniref:C-type cytochrome n=1 Tax=Flavobacterium resistens TaxID=443612 RepID=A0A521BM80_9FLAO|nr:cytochrome c [Flavobacterium resistens]MRX67518.1 c-type cytochrome [Flavobacterium resistens]SMO48209.1 Cytochrome c [Flavobacterium resistens]
MNKLFFIVALAFFLSSNTEKKLSDNKIYLQENYIKIDKTDPLYTKGRNIFKRDCAACHYIGMDLLGTAPPLGGITKLRKKDWLYKYTRNSYQMYEQGDKIAKEIRSKKSWGLMTSFPNLTDSDLDAIYYFVEKRYEMTKKGIPVEK